MPHPEKPLRDLPRPASSARTRSGDKAPDRGTNPSIVTAEGEHGLEAIYSAGEAGASTDFALDFSIGYHVRTAHRALQRYLQTKIGPFGVTLGMWYFLRVLWQQDGVTQSDLSRSVGTMEPTTMSAIAQMERIGIVRRERDPRDKRRQRVFLTPRGQALRHQLLPHAAAVLQDATQGMTIREIAMLLQLLRQIQSNLLEKIESPDPMLEDPEG